MGKGTELSVTQGSLLQVAQSQSVSIADAFVGVTAVVIVDESGSMSMCDSRGGKSRFKVACEELAKLQSGNPGKYLVIGFSSDVQPRIGGVPVEQGGGTDMAKALHYAKEFDVLNMKFFLVSDGEPDSPDKTLEEAKRYRNVIHTIFTGPESDPLGRNFLQKLATASGGQSTTADRVMELAEKVETLMLGSGA